MVAGRMAMVLVVVARALLLNVFAMEPRVLLLKVVATEPRVPLEAVAEATPLATDVNRPANALLAHPASSAMTKMDFVLMCFLLSGVIERQAPGPW